MRPALIAAAAGLYALIVGMLTLLGYAFDARRLTDWYNHGISMFPNTAVCAALSGVALLLLSTAGDRKSWRIVFRVAATLVGLLGGLTLLQHLAGVDLGIDTLLFQRSWGQRAAAAPMRMGPPASTSYLLIGAGLLLATYGTYARRLASAVAIVIVGIASLSLVGFWFGADQLFGVARFTGIAFQTSTVLAAIGFGLIASLPERGLAAMLRRNDPGSTIVRRLLAPVIAIPLALGWLRVLGQEAGYFDTAFGTAMLALVMITMLATLLWWTAQGVSRQTQLTRAAEESVRQSEARYRSLFEVAVYGVLTIDERGIIESANPATERLFGYSSSEMIGRNISLLMPEPYNAEHDSYLQNYLRTGVRKIIGIGREVVGQRKDRSTFPMDLAVSEFHLDSKRHFTGLVHDISQRKQTEQALRESERGQRLLAKVGELGERLPETDDLIGAICECVGKEFGVSRCGYTVADVEAGTFRVINDYFGDRRSLSGVYPMTEWATEEVFSGRVVISEDMTIAPRTADKYEELWGQLDLQACLSVPLHREGRLAAMFWVGHHEPRRWSAAEAELIKLIADRVWLVVERKRAEAALKEADRRKDEFLATLGHELRNVLAPVSVGAQLLRDAGAHPDLIEQAATVIHRQIHVLTRLVDDLLDVSRIAEGKLELRYEPLDFATLLHTAIEIARPTIREMEHELVLTLPVEPIAVHGDPVRLAQVFANLLNNAAKYTERAGTIHLTAAREDRAIVVSVRDTGIGIAPDVLPHIFDMFMQTAPGHAQSRGGLGIGLTLVKRLVELHGGSVTASSEGVGRGSEFVIRLPAAAASADPPVDPMHVLHAVAPVRESA